MAKDDQKTFLMMAPPKKALATISKDVESATQDAWRVIPKFAPRQFA